MIWTHWRRNSLVLGIVVLSASLPAHAQTAPERKPATLRVVLPAANAQLTIEQVLTRQSGTTRRFVSPPLEPGKNFSYTVMATWQPNNYTTITRTREVTVQSGQEVEADLREADDKQPDKIVVRYVPTPPEVVTAMLKLAGVGKDDVVYDLGCGDGRIVIAAVQQFHAKRGVGIDLDPQRVKESKANAKKAGVADDRLEFRQGDVLEIADLSSASVVTLYMGEELNLLVRPILRKVLKPGSRIVSHRFSMGDWKPLKSETLTDRNGVKYLIHLWKIGDDEAK